VEALIPWVKTTLAGKVKNVRVTKRLDAHPCVVTVEEMAAARHFIRTQSHLMNEEGRFALLQPQLELNPRWVSFNCHSALVTERELVLGSDFILKQGI
jgi:TNF receptor-associated protein 1